MKHYKSILLATCVSLVAPMAMATEIIGAPASVQAQADALEAQGFKVVRVRKTLLGRYEIKLYGNGLEREVVVDPATGAILRDYSEADDHDGSSGSGGGSSSSSSSDDSRDDDDDDRDDDRDDDDDDDDRDDDDDDDDDDDRDDDRDDDDDDDDDDD